MSKRVFSSALFEQMGGVNWLTRPGGVEFYPHNSDVVETPHESLFEQFGMEANSVETSGNSSELDSRRLPVNQPDLISQVVVETVQNPVIEKTAVRESSLSLNKLANIVVLGAGLDAIWQNDETLAWQLWQNIMLAFDWDESQMTFFDTSHLVSEEMIFTTMEEVIDLGVDWVLTMDDEHPISEQLVEGVHVVSVPDLESMLSDPYAKQSFYHAVVELSNPH